MKHQKAKLNDVIYESGIMGHVVFTIHRRMEIGHEVMNGFNVIVMNSLARNLECNAMLRQPATDIGSIDLIA